MFQTCSYTPISKMLSSTRRSPLYGLLVLSKIKSHLSQISLLRFCIETSLILDQFRGYLQQNSQKSSFVTHRFFMWQTTTPIAWKPVWGDGIVKRTYPRFSSLRSIRFHLLRWSVSELPETDASEDKDSLSKRRRSIFRNKLSSYQSTCIQCVHVR